MTEPGAPGSRMSEILAVTVAANGKKRIWNAREIAEAVRARPDLAPTFSTSQKALAYVIGRALRDARCRRYRQGGRHIRWLLPEAEQ